MGPPVRLRRPEDRLWNKSDDDGWGAVRRLKPQPPGPGGDGEGEALGDQAVGRARALAGAIRIQHFRRHRLQRLQAPAPNLAQELALVLPEDAYRLGRLLQRRAGTVQDQRLPEPAQVHAE